MPVPPPLPLKGDVVRTIDFRAVWALLTTLLLVLDAPRTAAGQDVAVEFGSGAALRQHHPRLYELVEDVERVHAWAFDALARGMERSVIDRVLTASLEDQVMEMSLGAIRNEFIVVDEAQPFERLGPRAAAVILWTHAFQREVLSILADPNVVDRRAALADAVAHYRTRPQAALPSAPKNMDVLYDHEFALSFRTTYPKLDGLAWAGHWLRLAATEPLTDRAPGPDRQMGIDTVVARYHAKLSFAEPPRSFPSELPLAPAIAPGLIWLSTESAMIWDNLSMLLEVLADVLTSVDPADTPRGIEAAVDFFLDPEAAVTDRDEWEIMALRHGIFHQGGYPLAVMTQSERNESGHAAHMQGGRMLRSIPGMRR